MEARETSRGHRGPFACVLGEIDLLRTLGQAGIPCAAVARPGDPTRWSRYTQAVVEWADPWREPEVLVERLLGFAATCEEPPALYYDGDWDLLMISRHRERLAEGFRFVVADAELVEALVDKALFQELAARHQLPVPAARVLRSGEPADVNGVRFPVVVKPLTRQHATWRPVARAKAARADGERELAALLARLGGADVDVLVQELVAGPESRIESYHVYVADSGERVAEFTGRKLRTYPRHYGYSTAVVTTDAGDVRELGREVVERLGLRGVAKLDFKRDADGRLLLLEINPRFNLWHSPGARAGVNIPALVHADLAGMDRQPAGAARPGVRWCNVLRDARAAREQKEPPLRWLRWAAGAETKGVVSLRDPLPLLRGAAWRVLRRRR